MKDDILKVDFETDKPGHVIEFRVYYALGGANYFTGTVEPRGYWASAAPIEVSNGFRSFKAFSGVKQFVHPCKRKSDAAAKEALSEAMEIQSKLLLGVESTSGLNIVRH